MSDIVLELSVPKATQGSQQRALDSSWGHRPPTSGLTVSVTVTFCRQVWLTYIWYKIGGLSKATGGASLLPARSQPTFCSGLSCEEALKYVGEEEMEASEKEQGNVPDLGSIIHATDLGK